MTLTPEQLAVVEKNKRESLDRAEVIHARTQLSLFVEAFASDVNPKDDQHTMEHPMFALGKRADKKTRTFSDARGRKTTVTPSHTGLATIYDKDLLLFVISHLMRAKNAGEPISPSVRIVSSQYLKFAHRGDGADDYKRVIPALDRLQGTQIKTEIETNGKRSIDAFGWISGYSVVTERNGKLYEFTVHLPPWVYNAILGDEVLSIGEDYFDLGPLERRLYEIGRKHLGKQAEWKISIAKLKAKAIGEAGELREFRRNLKPIVERGLPGLNLRLDGDDVHFRPAGPGALPGARSGE